MGGAFHEPRLIRCLGRENHEGNFGSLQYSASFGTNSGAQGNPGNAESAGGGEISKDGIHSGGSTDDTGNGRGATGCHLPPGW